MSDEDFVGRLPIVRGEGVTPTERYLKTLCDGTFLSLWSYPGVYRDQRIGPKTEGKEVCDLLVIFGDDIIIFSDKHSVFKTGGNPSVNWNRWFRRAVVAGADQLWGAERWIRQHPTRLFVDRACTVRLPIPLPDMTSARFHRVLVTHGATTACREGFGGSGSFIIQTDVRGFDAHINPFVIGDLSPSRGYVHVLDDTSLDVVLKTRDTVADFTHYLRKKEAFLRSGRAIYAAGEEELLAMYLTADTDRDEHDFPVTSEITGGIAIPEGHWTSFAHSTLRRAQLEHDEISYAWDELIEKFNYHALKGDDYFQPASDPRESELIMRFLAREPRTRRRMLAESLVGLVYRTPPHIRATRVIQPSEPGDPYYAFLLLPVPAGMDHTEYRLLRWGFLDALLRVVKLTCRDAEDIIVIATESGRDTEPRTEDAAYMDARDWCDVLEQEAIEAQRALNLLVNVSSFHNVVHEYPTVTRLGQLLVRPEKNPRNKPCPCRSGRKYKHCHGR